MLEEADETLFWLEILSETEISPAEVVAPLLKDANELVAILVTSINTARSKR